ncbi:MAG TPA: hypothetical protein VF070_27895 [Streptosporangiaceae bacterium]
MIQPTVKSKHPIAAHPVTSAIIAILIFASIFGTLWVPLYARATPKIGDFPFFYFYLLIYMPALAIVLWIVILLQNRLGAPPVPGSRSDRSEVQE